MPSLYLAGRPIGEEIFLPAFLPSAGRGIVRAMKPTDGLRHHHDFSPDSTSVERRTRIVIAITVLMMVLEVTAGIACNSMALLDDGSHMSTHAAAFLITAFAYSFARRRASDPKIAGPLQEPPRRTRGTRPHHHRNLEGLISRPGKEIAEGIPSGAISSGFPLYMTYII